MSKGRDKDAIDLVVSGTEVLLKQGGDALRQATDLCTYLIDNVASNHIAPTADYIGAIEKIAAAHEEKDSSTFLKDALKWTKEDGRHPRGDPVVHLLLAQNYRVLGKYDTAAQHYLFSEQPDEFADMLLQWSSSGRRQERDLFLGRAVLRLLCLENLGDANRVYDVFMERLGESGVELDSPLLNFCKFLMLTLEVRSRWWFVVVCKQGRGGVCVCVSVCNGGI